ncbi:DUF4240 domain-containing protein [Sporosarcina sp. HYO08]|uniref:DUF4240 domain-containing protein n=1 Tax=Sporosarcina sp. HYO08 TaxID=1759557 RepID=UPI000793255C|nr:DUF4240 domain-containing protein [Sporosarcina sp. HYO08]KXH87244.1 hypothetical protein AU377_01335 [Sporosarcina sp. HYO08]
MEKLKTDVNTGDLYAVKLPTDKWGAVKVLKRVDDSFLLLLTNYYEEKMPSLNHQSLKKAFYQNRGMIEGTDWSIFWVDGYPSKNYIWLRTEEISKHEEELESNRYAGNWKDYLPMDLVYQEEWERENKEAVHLRIKEVKDNESGDQLTYEHMDDAEFWSLICLLNGKQQKPLKKNVGILIKELSERTVETIFAFEETLSYKLFLLDTPAYAHQTHEADNYFSPDQFLYARCAVVARGQSYFERVLANPSLFDLDLEFEELLTVTSKAYKKKTKDNFSYISAYDYETFSNKQAWGL